jgi:hypothetical protein
MNRNARPSPAPPAFTFTGWPRQRWLRFVGIAAWVASVPVWAIQVLLLGIRFPTGGFFWLLDWHVYAAGAADLIDRSLYLVRLESPYPLPIEAFNYPPFAAFVVIPLLLLPDHIAGTVWIFLNVGAVAGSAVLVTKSIGVRQPMAWAGIAFAAYAVHPWAWLATLGNNSPIVLLLVTAFVHEHLRGRRRVAGILLGAAIAMKIWPIALVPLLLRESRWTTLVWAGGVSATATVGLLAWLGPNAFSDAFRALQVRDTVGAGNPVLGISWLRETFDWWPWWGGYAVAAVLLAIPARGKTGLGLGILAGLALVPNLWMHYLPSVVVGVILLLSGLRVGRRGMREGGATTSARLRESKKADSALRS